MASVSAVPRILQLDASVVNRIAAGEVIHRPSSALKEMLENCLDARSTAISVTVKNGGMTLLQISDDGCGINKSDFPLVCMRFATSKLSSYDDLSRIRTYGFRGEALASISHVARVSIVSLPNGAPCAFRAAFADGLIVGDISPCAGVPGTTITVEDMFFNVPARKAALSSTSEENRRIIEVVQRYAIRHAPRGVTFTCKQAASVSPDVHLTAGTSTINCIAAVFGHGIRRELLPLEVSREPPVQPTGVAMGAAATEQPTAINAEDDTALRFSASGYVSSANYSMKRGVCIFFINDRLVDCAPLRKAMEVVYAELLPKGSHPFIYLALDIPASHVDVNVHPTKREVNFLHQDSLIDAIVTGLTTALHGANSSRVFQAQTVLLPLTALAAAGPGPQPMEEVDLASSKLKATASGSRARKGARAAAAAVDAAAELHEGSRLSDEVAITDAGASSTLTASLLRGGVHASSADLELTAGAGDEDDGAARFGPVILKDGTSSEMSEAPASGAERPSMGSGLGLGLRRSSLGATLAGRASVGSRAKAQAGSARSSSAALSAVAPQKTVRVDSALATIDAYLTAHATAGGSKPASGAIAARAAARTARVSDAAASAANAQATDSMGGEGEAEIGADEKEDDSGVEVLEDSAPQAPLFTSVRELLAGVASARHEGLHLLIRRHILVGVLSESLSLLQHGTKLLLVNHEQLGRELFYQQALRLFGRAKAFAIQPPVDIETTVALALDARSIGPVVDRPALARQVAELLASKAAMLKEYFAIGIEGSANSGDEERDASEPRKRARTTEPERGDMDDADSAVLPSRLRATLTHLPRLVDGHTPQLPLLPDLIFSLAFEVDWDTEKECFHSVAQSLAAYYARLPAVPRELDETEVVDMRRESELAAQDPDAAAPPAVIAGPGGTSLWRGELVTARSLEEHRVEPASVFWQVAHVLLPACRAALTPPAKLARSQHVVQLACTEQLYKIFERC